MRLITLFFALLFSYSVKAQDAKKDTILIYKFSDAFSLMVSEDESKLVVIIDNNKFEIYEIDPLAYIKRFKVTRNTWLDKAFFYNNNQSIFYDYGTQLRFKYKKLDIETGKKKNINCHEVPKGCGYKSTKCCNDDNPILILNNKPYIFKVEDIDIAIYKINCPQYDI